MTLMYMNFNRILHSEYGRYIISILLGLGLATLFRRVCKERNCLMFRAPDLEEIKQKTYKFNGKYYRFEENPESCDGRKKIVQFA